MTKIDIFSGFLGAGKTTLIRKLIKEGYKGEKIVLIENEFGDIAIDGGFLKDAGVEITEMNSGCICCTLVGDFTQALKKVMDELSPDRILIEPSGVGKLSDVSAAVEKVPGAEIGCKVAVVDALKCRMYLKNFGEFFKNQVENADMLVLSRTGADNMTPAKLQMAIRLLSELNPKAALITTPWEYFDGEMLVREMHGSSLQAQLKEMEEEMEHHHHHEHHHDHEHEHEHEHHHDHEHEHHHEHDENCTCGCHDHDHEHEHEHHHEHDHEHEHEHHHDHDHEHEHHHEHDENCTCGCHDHDHHHHHHADEIFTSWGMETAKKFTEEELKAILDSLNDESRFGTVLRAKGIVDGGEGKWLYFDYVPGESEIRFGSAELTGRFCVIGSGINTEELNKLFG